MVGAEEVIVEETIAETMSRWKKRRVILEETPAMAREAAGEEEVAEEAKEAAIEEAKEKTTPHRRGKGGSPWEHPSSVSPGAMAMTPGRIGHFFDHSEFGPFRVSPIQRVEHKFFDALRRGVSTR